MFDPIRVTTVDGDTVRWANGIGMYVGQSGTWRFASPEDAQTFADYASNGFPSLAPDDLEAAGIPRPVAVVEGDGVGYPREDVCPGPAPPQTAHEGAPHPDCPECGADA